jgi:hypothetical protein
MATTRTLQQTVNWAMTLTQMTPIIGVSGFAEEPALTICNNVIQEMIAPPFNWKFNSVDASPFFTVASSAVGSNPCPEATPNCPTPCSSTLVCIPQQDYPVTFTDIAWIEAAWRIDNLSTAALQPLDNMEAVRILRPSSSVSDPEKLAFMYENNDGGIIRLWPVPSLSKQWQVFFAYQRKVPIKADLSENWAPFPDEMAWVYQKGFLAQAYKHANDSRYSEAQNEFIAAMHKQLGHEDSEGNSEGFQPDHGLFLG